MVKMHRRTSSNGKKQGVVTGSMNLKSRKGGLPERRGKRQGGRPPYIKQNPDPMCGGGKKSGDSVKKFKQEAHSLSKEKDSGQRNDGGDPTKNVEWYQSEMKDAGGIVRVKG